MPLLAADRLFQVFAATTQNARLQSEQQTCELLSQQEISMRSFVPHSNVVLRHGFVVRFWRSAASRRTSRRPLLRLPVAAAFYQPRHRTVRCDQQRT